MMMTTTMTAVVMVMAAHTVVMAARTVVMVARTVVMDTVLQGISNSRTTSRHLHHFLNKRTTVQV